MDFNKKAIIDNETGLGNNAKLNGGRFFNKDGNANIKVTGVPFYKSVSVFHFFIGLSWWQFLIMLFAFFVIVNLFFACLYYIIGVQHLGGLVANSETDKFAEAFFFSTQTFTTVGYGRINPLGFLANIVAAIEALIGLICFALVTGLLYGRFAKPKAFLKFSDKAIFAPYKDGIGLMLRMVPFTKHYLSNVEAKVTLAMRISDDGVIKNKFFNLELELSKANNLTTNWTLVHPINENSPIWGFKKKDIEEAFVEILVFVQGFDEVFSNTVVARTSYTFNEFAYGVKFVPMFHPSQNDDSTILELDLLNTYNQVTLPTNIE